MAWLYEPTDKAALGDVAKLAVTLRSGAVPGLFIDGGAEDVPLGKVGRVQLLAPGDLGLPDSSRKFALGRGTDQLCLAEIIAGEAGEAEARAHLEAVEQQRQRGGGKPVMGWLIAGRVTVEALAVLAGAGCVGSSTGKLESG